MRKSKRLPQAAYAMDILRSNVKFYGYPILRVIAMLALLTAMWPWMFDVSGLAVGEAAGDLLSTVERYDFLRQGITAGENKQLGVEVGNVRQHMHVWYCLLFFVINNFIGVFSLAALTGQLLAVARGEQRIFGYGYGLALKRFPQLFVWWMVSVVVLFCIRLPGRWTSRSLRPTWSIMTFFSSTVIMDTGCGPVRAFGDAKKMILDVVKKTCGEEEGDLPDLRQVRRRFTVGLPLAYIHTALFWSIIALLLLDFLTLPQSIHHMLLGAIWALIIVICANAAILKALWAVVKTTIYYWALEGQLPETVDESEVQHAFVVHGHQSRQGTAPDAV